MTPKATGPHDAQPWLHATCVAASTLHILAHHGVCAAAWGTPHACNQHTAVHAALGAVCTLSA